MIFADGQDITLGGWTNVVIQGGCLVLLYVLIVHIVPKFLTEAKEERQARDKCFTDAINALHGKMDDRNDKIVAAIKEQTSSINLQISSGAESTRQAMLSVCKSSNHVAHIQTGRPQ